ncbi:MAG TPA: hypothetical protein VFO16_20565 [Pseudonocardiaceae bacterium]|nr:hypothetical protein [Pseudonocardiaceae bacterium]
MLRIADATACGGHVNLVSLPGRQSDPPRRSGMEGLEVQEMMAQRGVVASPETIRQRCAKSGQIHANVLRRRRVRPGDTWHLSDMFITINGKTHYPWRVVDQHGVHFSALSKPDTTPAPQHQPGSRHRPMIFAVMA